MTNRDFEYTEAVRKLRKLKKRVRVVPGGTSAGKTYGIIPVLIDTAIKNKNLEISIVSETIPHLRKGALKDFLKIMKGTGRYVEDHYNRTLLTYTFASGSYIEFFSADQESKVRGPRRHILYVNECNNMSFETYHQLAIRTSKIIWLDFNPSHEFWVHTELEDDPDAEWLVLTYEDNGALPDTIVNEIEKGRDKAYFDPTLPVPELFDPKNIKKFYWHNWWKVYGLGMLGSLEGVIFTNWSQIDTVPKQAKLVGYGMDFGFTNDPSTLVAAYEWNGRYIWEELIYETGMLNRDIAMRMKNLGVRIGDHVIADSSEPKSIAEINKYGFRVRGAEKGPGSVNFGIDLLQEDDFFVTKNSTNLINELRKYMWDKDRDGVALNQPIDQHNHLIDAMRYLAMSRITKQKQGRGIRRRN